jgi:hypothetical protein
MRSSHKDLEKWPGLIFETPLDIGKTDIAEPVHPLWPLLQAKGRVGSAFSGLYFSLALTWEDRTIYWEPSFLAVVRFGSTPPPPLPAVSDTQKDWERETYDRKRAWSSIRQSILSGLWLTSPMSSRMGLSSSRLCLEEMENTKMKAWPEQERNIQYFHPISTCRISCCIAINSKVM